MSTNASTRLTRLLGLRHPIIQGPMGGGNSPPALAAAVSNAGGLGSLGVYHLHPDEIRTVIAETRDATSRPFAVNLWVPRDEPLPTAESLAPDQLEAAKSRLRPLRRELDLPEEWGIPPVERPEFAAQVRAVLEATPAVFSFVFGIPPAEVLRECRERGIVTVGTATTVAEAVALEAAGVEVVCASGFEAGGHRGAFLRPAEESLVGTLALVPQVASAVRIPVIAAGGIADARGVVAALALGADAAQLGTAFLACRESGASAPHREALFAGARDTTLTRAASGRHARMIRNRFTESLSAGEPLPFPLQGPLQRELQRAAVAAGRTDLMAMYAGQSAALLTHRDAAGLVAALASEAGALLGRMAAV